MSTNMHASFPSPARQLQAEREMIAVRQLAQINRARRKQGLEPLPIDGVEKDEDVTVCENPSTKRWLIAYLATILTIIALAGLQILDTLH